MGTHSRIGVMHGDKVKSVYCHWDGYLEHNGQVLEQYYDSAKANNLVALGDMSTLRPQIGEKHAFSQFDLPPEEVEAYKELTRDWCTFYGRDRGEVSVWKVANTFEEFLDQADGCGAEFYYIMKDGVWYCGDMYESTPLSKKLTALADALESETVDQ